MGNPDAKAAAKKRKEERQRAKVYVNGKLQGERSSRRGTARKHIQGKRSSNTKDPRVK